MPRKIRQIRIEGNLAYVPLTRGLEAVIDAADVSLVDKWNWFATSSARAIYAVRNDYSTNKQTYVIMHRVLMGNPEELSVDHINGDGLDNRRGNLRFATNAENGRNRGIPKNNTSGFKGVIWDKREGRWRAALKVNGKTKFLGYFDAPEAAHEAYLRAAETFHGEFAFHKRAFVTPTFRHDPGLEADETGE